ncbi:MAG: non-hydrolyzing UDP-N-acetylglucosamine 2-epimerase [bacterium]
MKVSIIFGTRPETIKLAPVILAMRKHPKIDCHVCVTAQHRDMLDQVLKDFDIKPDEDLDIMRPNQTLAEITVRGLKAIDAYLDKEKPNMVLVQGDTTTTFVASLAAFYYKIPLGHVEAGLRTWNMHSPWPEEANRVLTSRLAALHFAPTENNRQNLLKEGILPENIFVTGNTGIDALFYAIKKVQENPPDIPGIDSNIIKKSGDSRTVLITGHRRENFGEGFESICKAIVQLANDFPKVQFIYPVHMNPNVRSIVLRMLGCNNKKRKQSKNVHIINPIPYLPFVALMDRSTLILTDSGGIQEEAPSLGKPVLVMRDTTERPEAIEAQTAKIIGTNYKNIVKEATRLLTDQEAYKKMDYSHNPYGDGKASARIIKIISEQRCLYKLS